MRISDWSSECALPISIDRERVARTLGFDGVCRNSLDAVSDRDFAIEFCAAAALVMTHVSRLSEELVLWINPRVGFIDLADRFCRSEEHTSELQSLMRISYAVFCLKKKNKANTTH